MSQLSTLATEAQTVKCKVSVSSGLTVQDGSLVPTLILQEQAVHGFKLDPKLTAKRTTILKDQYATEVGTMLGLYENLMAHPKKLRSSVIPGTGYTVEGLHKTIAHPDDPASRAFLLGMSVALTKIAVQILQAKENYGEDNWEVSYNEPTIRVGSFRESDSKWVIETKDPCPEFVKNALQMELASEKAQMHYNYNSIFYVPYSTDESGKAQHSKEKIVGDVTAKEWWKHTGNYQHRTREIDNIPTRALDACTRNAIATVQKEEGSDFELVYREDQDTKV